MTEAIAPTHGILMLDSEGGILDAVYSANCGGRTAPNHLVWTSRPNPHLQGVWDTPAPLNLDLTKESDIAKHIRSSPNAHCNHKGIEGADKFRWTKTLGTADWAKVVEAAGVGRIKDVSGFQRDPSGRLHTINITGENGLRTIMKELPIRRIFSMLRSAAFIVSFSRDKDGFINGAEFMGSGWGHGVGMCQSGAQYLATQNLDFAAILAHYFPGSRLVKFY